MSHAALTAKYRPQTFADVAGQETLKAILSRASLEQRVAPAYLFSGTRGVGKTTLARIFAKALNCRTAPAAEPCNQCDQCRAITAGNAVDVVEIDGASNRGIDDVRRLKEVVGYAPMEGAFKIFIIDEAHMLSREAFNALLKTLEEPPARVTFIMATTEPHKFPATIISRCQHYVFKRLPEKGLVDHLSAVLAKEKVEYDESAVRLIARRGAGSVRDSMSLLGQVLALQDGRLSEDAARSVLGLAGQEAFLRMLDAFRDGDGLALSRMLREMLDQGLDMGFFLRELSSLWRNLFMLRQSGEPALEVVDLPRDEARSYLDASAGFSLQHVHAAWQMTLEGQRRVLTSLEPASALELLLLNLAMLPRLLSLENVSALARRADQRSSGGSGGSNPGGNPGGGTGEPGRQGGRESGSNQGGGRAMARAAEANSASPGRNTPAPGDGGGPVPNHSATAQPAAQPVMGHMEHPEEEPGNPDEAAIQEAYAELGTLTKLPDTPAEPAEASPAARVSDSGGPGGVDGPPSALPGTPGVSQGVPAGDAVEQTVPEPHSPAGAIPEAVVIEASVQETAASAHEPLPLWDSIFRFCAETEAPPWLSTLLRKVSAREIGGVLVLTAEDSFTGDRLREPEAMRQLEMLLTAWCGRFPAVRIETVEKGRKTREELKAEVLEHPLVKEVEARFGAYVIDYGQLR